MSVYSGFVTRQLETSYNKTVFAALFLLQNAIARHLEVENKDLFGEGDSRILSKAFLRMVNLEKRKQLQPKFSKALTRLAELLNFSHNAKQLKLESEEEGYSSIEIPTSIKNTQNSIQKSKQSPFKT
jgi:hypothetical protein